MSDAALEQQLVRAGAAIRAGALVGMPTETVYGLAGSARDEAALLRIFTAKGRPRFDPLIVHVASVDEAWSVGVPSPRARALARRFWPGPLTLVLERQCGVSDLITAGLSTVAVRLPDHPLAQALIREAGVPLAAPSANLFGRLSPTLAAHVAEQLGDAVAEVLDGGPCRVGIESTVIRPDPQPLILRPGGITRAAIEAVLGELVAVAGQGQRQDALALPAPGMLKSHYAPSTPLVLRQGPWPAARPLAVLSWRGEQLPPDVLASEVLSRAGDPQEAARRLFVCLRRLDAVGAALIAAELVPESGLGEGINDRLRRAAGLG